MDQNSPVYSKAQQQVSADAAPGEPPRMVHEVAISPVRPVSAVSAAVGWLGVCGLILWLMIARHYGMDGPYSALTCVVAAGVPMVLWSVLVDKVHRNPSTGIDWDGPPKKISEIRHFSMVKLIGLWSTWALIGFLYSIARWYWTGAYQFSMRMFMAWAPFLVIASIPYVLWLDRRLIQPRDHAYAFGRWIMGTATADHSVEIFHHLRAWAVKGFFIAFMISIVPGGFAHIVQFRWSDSIASPVSLTHSAVVIMFLFDVHIAMVGYLLTLRPLDAHIRTANPFLQGWVAALICYPPLILMDVGRPLDYHPGTYGEAGWATWLAGHTFALSLFGIIIVLLTALYAWATIAFGLRFSNLTHRGILTHGPYAWMRHPAYLSKNSYWWVATLPMFVSTGSYSDAIRNCVILATVNAVYYWRAKTEEKHLMADPDYVAYWNWAERHAPLTVAMNRMLRRKPRTAIVRTDEEA